MCVYYNDNNEICILLKQQYRVYNNKNTLFYIARKVLLIIILLLLRTRAAENVCLNHLLFVRYYYDIFQRCENCMGGNNEIPFRGAACNDNRTSSTRISRFRERAWKKKTEIIITKLLFVLIISLFILYITTEAGDFSFGSYKHLVVFLSVPLRLEILRSLRFYYVQRSGPLHR